jgi:hypothetical protein
MEKICDTVAITLNKNAVLGDKSALTPGTTPTPCSLSQTTFPPR